MTVKKILILVLITLVSCDNKSHLPKQDNLIIDDTIKNEYTIDESIIDSNNIGIKSQFKLDIRQIRNLEEGVYVVFNLYEKHEKDWVVRQTYSIRKDGLTNMDLMISDFNNDGFNDMTFQSAVAARTDNEIKSLFIFDKAAFEFKLIKNSSHYPNLRYNKELDCIDAWLIYGGSSTLFLKIDSDTLREFAGIDLYNYYLTVYQIDEHDNIKILLEGQKKI
jgi:hypothetical protein